MAGVHEDFGEKIGGAKKDLWKDRGLYADDLEAMNEREAEKFVKKDNVWKKPDYAAILEEGIPLGVVYFIKKARDGLNASPQYYRTDDTPEKRTARQKEYIKTVRELQAVLSDVRTAEDAVRAYDRFFVDNGYLEKVQGWGSGIHYRATKKGQDNPVITNKLSNTMLIRSAEYFERNFTQKAKKEQFCVSKEQKIPKGYAIHFNDGKHTYSKNEDWKPGTYYVTKGYSILLPRQFRKNMSVILWFMALSYLVIRLKDWNRPKRNMPPPRFRRAVFLRPKTREAFRPGEALCGKNPGKNASRSRYGNEKEGGYTVMKVLMVEPGKSPYAAEIESGLKSLQAAVGGDIQAVYPYEDPVALICNDEGKLMGLPLNRALFDDDGHVYDIVSGNFLIVGLGEEDFTDLSLDLMEKYGEQFKYPEKFARIVGEIIAVKQPATNEHREKPMMHHSGPDL